MVKWRDTDELSMGQTPQPIIWQEVWGEEAHPLPVVTPGDFKAIHGNKARSSRILTYGHIGNSLQDQQPHFVATRNGYEMHTDPRFRRYAHEVVLFNDGWVCQGLNRSAAPQPRGAFYCLDAHSPHEIVSDRRIGLTGIHKLVACVSADKVLTPEQVRGILGPFLASSHKPHLTRSTA